MGEALFFFSLNDHVSEERDFPKWQQHVHSALLLLYTRSLTPSLASNAELASCSSFKARSSNTTTNAMG